jgi:hypothetical protein
MTRRIGATVHDVTRFHGCVRLPENVPSGLCAHLLTTELSKELAGTDVYSVQLAQLDPADVHETLTTPPDESPRAEAAPAM